MAGLVVQRDAKAAPAPGKPADDFVKGWAHSAIEKLDAADQKRFKAIEWGWLDFPGQTWPLSKVPEADLPKWRTDKAIVEATVGGQAVFVGIHQADAEALLKAVTRKAGGERRVNAGKQAVIIESEFKLAKKDFDTYIVSQLDSSGDGGHQLHKKAATDYKAMKEAAKKDGVVLSIASAYRDRASEEAKAKENKNRKAFGGFSPHALGLAIDFDLNAAASTDMRKTVGLLSSPVYKWLMLHAKEHKFFPYAMEPWHWEYNPDDFRDTFFDDAPELKKKLTDERQRVADAEAAEQAKKAAARAKAKAKAKPKAPPKKK